MSKPSFEEQCVYCGMKVLKHIKPGEDADAHKIVYACGSQLTGNIVHHFANQSYACKEIQSLKEQVASWSKLANPRFSQAVYELKKSLSYLAKLSEKNHKRVKGGRDALKAIIQHEGRLRHYADVNNNQVF